MWEKLSRTQEKPNHCSNTDITWKTRRIYSIQWCIKQRTRMCVNAKWKGNCLCFKAVKTSWSKLLNAWFRVRNSILRNKNMKTLPMYILSINFYRPYEFEVLYVTWKLNIWQRRWKELIKDFNCVIDYHLGKANIAA